MILLTTYRKNKINSSHIKVIEINNSNILNLIKVVVN